ncbi:hypothetical protein VQD75_001276 [Vibrio alginolyticus]|nr:hypothetical protein [Vibrio alginolyticus]
MNIQTKGLTLKEAGFFDDLTSIVGEEFISTKNAAKSLMLKDHLLSSSSSLVDFLNQPHDQYVPGSNPSTYTSSDSEEAIKEGQEGVQKYQSISEPTQQEIEEMAAVFQAYPSQAVSTLLNAARVESGWDPISGDSEDSAKGFANYTQIVSSISLFEIVTVDSKELHYEEKNYKDLITKATAAVSSIFTGDPDKITSALTDLAVACTSQSNTKNTATTFAQNEITTESVGRDVWYSLGYTWMQMEYSENSGKSAPANEFKSATKVVGAKFKFSSLLLTKPMAEKLARLQYGVCSLDEFNKSITTPIAPQFKTCLR